MINVIINGAAGRMGKANIAVFSEDREVCIVGAIEHKDSRFLGQDAGSLAGIEKIGVPLSSIIGDAIEKADVVVDFTNCETTLKNLKFVQDYKKAMVIGTTGFSNEQIESIRNYSKNLPIVLSPNMSLGVNTLFYLVRQATKLLGESFDVEIFEIHHNLKKDAPSGTALQFCRIIAEQRGKNLEDVANFGRHGLVGERKKGEIGIMALRVSDVVGEHTIIFGGIGERVEFVHKCASRKTFAHGALRAVKFIVDKKSGFFGMEDVLGIK